MAEIKKIVKKIQGKGTAKAKDSWWIYYTDPDRIPELVFEDPNIEKKQDLSKIDIDSITDADLDKLADKLKSRLGL